MSRTRLRPDQFMDGTINIKNISDEVFVNKTSVTGNVTLAPQVDGTIFQPAERQINILEE